MSVKLDNVENDHIHKISEELVEFRLIHEKIKLKKRDSICSNISFLGTIYYKSHINYLNDGAIVSFIGHESGHKSPITIVEICIILFIIIIYILYVHSNPFLIIILSGILLFILRSYFSKRELKADEVGAKILLDYGRKKNYKVCPSESFKELFDGVKSNSTSLTYIFRYIFNNIFGWHPPDNVRIKKLEEFEKQYYSQEGIDK